MDKTCDGFNFLKTKFPRLSEAKIEGPQIRQLFKDSTFMKHLNRKEKRAWLAFKNVCIDFLGSKKSHDYVAHVEECGATCRLKCFAFTHTWTFSLKIYEQVFDKHWERFHQDIAQFERRFSGKWNASMLAEYSWSLVRKTSTSWYKRKANTR
ncbi:hypothetical protein AVEN_186509-1 [Araneus ventricosus]|uniref:Uncharacterized protein n=1 Tax=Araneus ventricosus TaxID=182803 RepID=A0A4Y2N4N8_ARAVE|nr:hypothetical protein AVEN_186509-1 [Araneus ventricosus]